MTFVDAIKINDSYPIKGIWFEEQVAKKFERQPESTKYNKFDYGFGRLVGFFLKTNINSKSQNEPMVIIIANQFKNKDGIYIIKMSSEINNELYCTFIKNNKILLGSDRVYFEDDVDELINFTGIDEIYDITHESIF